MNRIDRETTVSCREVRDVLAVWAETTDLPEPVAIHVGACTECRAAFDRRFPLFPIVPEAVDPAVRARFLRPRRSVAPLVLAAAAAVALVASSVMPSEAHYTEVSELFPPVCPDEAPWSLPECPPA
jgi:hypothetical protein